jgi:hypothetical protein
VRANGWDALDPSAAAGTAAAAYKGLARLLATSHARQALSARLHLKNDAPIVLDRLGADLVQLVRLRTGSAAGVAVPASAHSVAVLAAAHANLSELLRLLLPTLEPLISDSNDQRLTQANAMAALEAARSMDT